MICGPLAKLAKTSNWLKNMLVDTYFQLRERYSLTLTGKGKRVHFGILLVPSTLHIFLYTHAFQDDQLAIG